MMFLHPYLDSFVIVYLDDILVYSATWEEHISHLMQVLETLKKHQLLANLKKCEFSQQSLVYLGYVIGGGELKIDPTKMEAIMKWPVPTNCTEVRSFVGETQYLWKFIASFSVVVAPLHAITMGSKSFQWGKNQQKAFDEMKINISQAPSAHATKLAESLRSGDRCKWVCHGSSLDAGRKACLLSF
jgi:hypothetical protein